MDPVSYLAPQAKRPDYNTAETWAAHTHTDKWPVVEHAAADTWNIVPAKYNASFKNPCWWTDQGTYLRCLPYFQILGVSKCGTTDLYHRLEPHPDFVECSWKGPHFFDESMFPSTHTHRPGKYNGSFTAYVSIYDKAAQRIAEDPGVRITGEASSNTFTGVYTFLRGNLFAKRMADTGVTLAHYLKEVAPWSRFVVLMRNPVDRYYSAYYYYRSKRAGPGTPLDFQQRVSDDIEAWYSCVKDDGEPRCLMRYQPQQLVKGMYGAFLPGWLAVWPSSHFLLLRTEDYKAAPSEHVMAVSDFLGLRRLEGKEMREVVATKKRNVKSYVPMLNETRIMLQNFYRPFNQRLSELMGNDPRWLWGY